MGHIKYILAFMLVVATAAAVFASPVEEYPPDRYYGEIIFKDGGKLGYIWISDSESVGLGLWESDRIAFSKVIEPPQPKRWIRFSNISRIDFFDMTTEESEQIEDRIKATTGWEKQQYEKIRKARITFNDGKVWENIYLYPQSFGYKTRYEEGDISETVVSITFNMKNVKICPKCSRQYTNQEWKFCPYDGEPLELQE